MMVETEIGPPSQNILLGDSALCFGCSPMLQWFLPIVTLYVFAMQKSQIPSWNHQSASHFIQYSWAIELSSCTGRLPVHVNCSGPNVLTLEHDWYS